MVTLCTVPARPGAASRHRPCPSGDHGTRREGAGMQPRPGILLWAGARLQLEPSCLCHEEFGWGRRDPGGNWIQRPLQSRLWYLNALTHRIHRILVPTSPPNKRRQLLQSISSAGTRILLLVPVPFPLSTFSKSPNFPVLGGPAAASPPPAALSHFSKLDLSPSAALPAPQQPHGCEL